MSDKDYRLEIDAARGKSGDLKGPTRQDMGMRVAECLDAGIHVRLLDQDGQVLFDEIGTHGGLESAGNIGKLLSTKD
jgi:hypothetical protein